MATSIANLAVILGLDSNRFNRGMDLARAKYLSFSATIAKAGSSLAPLATGLGIIGGAAAVGTVALVKSQMEAIDVTAKLADQLGLTTQSILGLRHAANLAGVDQSGFDKAIEKFTLNLDAARTGSKTASDAFAALGLDVTRVTSSSPDEALLQVADAMSRTKDQTQAAAIAVDLFGKEGVAMLSVLSGGRAGLTAAAAELQRLGGMFSRIDAAKVEAANDSITRLETLLKGVGITLAVEVAPFVEALAVKLIETATAGESVGSRMARGFESALTLVGKLGDGLNALLGVFRFLQASTTQGLAMAAWSASKLFEAIDAGLERLGQRTTGVGQTLGQLTANLRQDADAAFAASGQALADAWGGKASQQIAATFADIRAKADAAAQAIASASRAQAGVRPAQAAAPTAAKADDASRRRMEEQRAFIDDLRRQMDTLALGEDGLKLIDAQALFGAGAELDKIRTMLAAIRQAEADNARQANLASTLDQLRERARFAGMTAREETIARLRDNLATQDQIDEANRLMDTLDKADAKAGASAGRGGANELVLAGSARAQQLAYNPAGATADKTLTRQLAVQVKSSTYLEDIKELLAAAGETPGWAI